jgi:uncharacterized protein YyaL (SSP411 family)
MADTDATAPTNRLAGASSPYLLLHRHNPVDWYPWGEEAIERARREDKPIFLSVGYSTCYWCHVMERESFSSPAVAAAMNASFVNVKLDREERPDLDELYMVATQLMTGQGGWPNSVFLTPRLEPFFAGTYFPPEDRWGRPGFRSLLAGVDQAWRERRDEVEAQAKELAGAVGQYLQHRLAPASAPPGPEVAAASLRSLAERFDPVWGGFGEAPKFPSPANLTLLLEAGRHDAEARRMLAVTLDRMARGGIYDQLAGGFHRYATDREWKVPHFEKMLYDNGALLEVYARAWELLGDPELERVTRETAGFLSRELSDPGGGLWSAIDAETGGREGAYYVWTREELEAALGPEDAAFLAPLHGFDGAPFFEERSFVLHLPRPLAEQAERRRVSREDLLAAMAPLRRRLLAARDGRQRPLTDDKVLADWNGLAIAGLAVAGRLLGEPQWVARAAAAADFLLTTLRTAPDAGPADPAANGRGALLHAWRAGRGEVPAFLADYAYLVHGLLALHEASGEPRWLDAAEELTAEQRRRLEHEDGGFYTAAARPDLLFRSREVFDGATASPNGVAVLNLLALAERRGDDGYREQAGRALRAFAPLVAAQPAAARTLAIAAARYAAREDGVGSPPPWVAARGGATAAVGAGPAGVEPTTLRPQGLAEQLEEGARRAVRARLEVDPAPAGDPAGWRAFRLRLEVVPGWHLAAAGGPVGGSGLAVEGDGCELRGVRLPVAQPLRMTDGVEQPSFAGTLEIRGELLPNAPRSWLQVRFQACDERRCLPPATHRLAV